jgi:hypothetical protein
LYNSARELAKLAGHKNADLFFTPPGQPADPRDPASAPLQRPPDPKQQQIEMQAQAQQQKVAAAQAHERMKVEANVTLQQMRFEIDTRLKMLDAHIKAIQSANELQQAREHHAIDIAAKQQDHAMRLEQAAAKTAGVSAE